MKAKLKHMLADITSLTKRAANSAALHATAAVFTPIFLVAAISFWLPMNAIELNSFWQFIAAIATAVAAATALYLGLGGQRKIRKDREEEASVLEIIINEDLKGLLPTVARIAQICKSVQNQDLPKDTQEKLLQEIKDAAQAADMPCFKAAFASTKSLTSDKMLAILKIYTSLPGLTRRCAKIANIKQLGRDIGNYPDLGLAIHMDIKRISFYAKYFLPDQTKHYWRHLKVWSDAYKPEEGSFHDLPK